MTVGPATHGPVEPARPDDLDAIRALPLGPSTKALLPHDLHSDARWVRVVREGAPDDGRVGSGGSVVGAAVLAMQADDAHLLDVAVAPTHRRRGIGTALVAAVQRLARDELGATGTTLEVRESNAGARAMYRRLGFHEAGVRPGYYPDGGPGGGREDAVVMWDTDDHDA